MEKIAITNWVDQDPDNRTFRQAVHTLLHAISITEALQSSMIMKGGILLALGYRSERYTGDIDFSTQQTLAEFDIESFREKLEEGLVYAVEELGYGLDCLIQKIKQKPPREDATFPTITVTIGYAYKSDVRLHKRLQKGMSTQTIKIDYSLNESVGDFEFFELDGGHTVRVYDTVEIISEKFRALLQQEVRNRVRAQDLYDLYYILDVCSLSDDKALSAIILKRLIEKSASRNLGVSAESMSNPEIRSRSAAGYKDLVSLVEEKLLPFEQVYDEVESYYRSLPWAPN